MSRAETDRLPDSALRAIRSARRLLVLTGAGMSAESGIPTFRDAQTGLWARFRPEDLATPEAFRANPRRVWEWYAWRRGQVAAAEPHAGYHALVAMEQLLENVCIITQNVDGLHQAAGSSSVIELHGNIMRSVCSVSRMAIDDDWIAAAKEVPPRSPHAAGGLARPDVVWFGEALPPGAMERAWAQAEAADVCLSVGTSSLVQPAASLPLAAHEAGALLIEINPGPTPLSTVADLCIRQPAGRALPAILDSLRTE